MSKEHSDEKDSPSEEPFFLSILPFAGLGLLLVLALAWRYIPRGGSTAETASADPGAMVIERWDRAPSEELTIGPDDFALGPETAPLTLVEFSDFECPFCRGGAAAVKELLEQHPASVRVVFKNLPLDTACNDGMTQQLHPFACRAAVLARCAGEENPEDFWDAHDALFRASAFSDGVLDQILGELPRSREEIEACMDSSGPLEKVKADVAEARRLGVTGTPTFFLNGRRVADYRDGILGRLVEHALSAGGGGS